MTLRFKLVPQPITPEVTAELVYGRLEGARHTGGLLYGVVNALFAPKHGLQFFSTPYRARYVLSLRALADLIENEMVEVED